MEGFGGIVGIGQLKKPGSLGGIGGGVQGLSSKDKRMSGSGNTPAN